MCARRHLLQLSFAVLISLLGSLSFADECGFGVVRPSGEHRGVAFRDVSQRYREDIVDVVVLHDRRIVALSATRNDGTGEDFTITAFHPDGSIDWDFGERGKLVVDFGTRTDRPKKLLYDRSRSALYAAGTVNHDGDWDFGIVRFDTMGRLHPYFGDGGIQLVGWGDDDILSDAILVEDGKILLTGSAILCEFFGGCNNAIATARLHRNRK